MVGENIEQGGNEKEQEPKLLEWDSLAIRSFGIVVVSACVLYAVYFSDLIVALYGLLSIAILHSYAQDESSEFYKSLSRVYEPLVESAIVLLLFFDWIMFILPMVQGLGLGVVLVGYSAFGFLVPLVFLVVYRRNSRASIGLRLPDGKSGWRLAVGFCCVIVCSVLVRLAITPGAFQYLLSAEALGALIVGALYLGLFVGFTEEFVFRGVIQNRVSLRLRSRVAGLIVTSSLFAALHLFSVYTGAGGIYGSLSYSLLYAFLTRLPMGIIFGVIWNRSESVFPPFIAHATNNIAFVVLLIAGCA